MKHSILRLTLMIFLAVSLMACFGPKTPQDVSQAFWKAVLENDTDDVIDTSTLTESKYYDGFSLDWSGFQPAFGKVVIDGNAASIDTDMNSPANSGQGDRHFTTYLVLSSEQWQVDYDRTKQSIHGGPLGELVSKLNQVGSNLSQQLTSSADAFQVEMGRLGAELQQYSDEFSQQASKSVEQYAEQLRRNIQEMEEAIDRALKDENNKLSNEDKHELREIANDLDRDSQNLEDPSIETVTQSGNRLGEKQLRLEAIDNEALNEYKEVWHDLGRQLEKDLRQLLDELSSQHKHDD